MRQRSTRAHLGGSSAIKSCREGEPPGRGQGAPCCQWIRFSRRAPQIPRRYDETPTVLRVAPGIADARVLACARSPQTLALPSPRFALFPWWQSIGWVMTMRLQKLSSIMVPLYLKRLVCVARGIYKNVKMPALLPLVGLCRYEELIMGIAGYD